MILTINKETCVVFDLDDTLYNEADFLKSAYQHIARLVLPYTGVDIYPQMLNLYLSGKSTLDVIKENYTFPYSVKDIVHEYRYHKPHLSLSNEASCLLKQVKMGAGRVGLLTDGRSLTQRNKIDALGILHYFDDIRISEETGCEKPAEECFLFFQKKYSSFTQFIYIGDNISKDFVTANRLGWQTFGLKMNEWNIHKQDLGIDACFHPKVWITSLSELVSE